MSLKQIIDDKVVNGKLFSLFTVRFSVVNRMSRPSEWEANRHVAKVKVAEEIQANFIQFEVIHLEILFTLFFLVSLLNIFNELH